MLQGEHSAILSTFVKLPFVIMIFALSIFEWPFHTGFTVNSEYFLIHHRAKPGPEYVGKRLEPNVIDFNHSSLHYLSLMTHSVIYQIYHL